MQVSWSPDPVFLATVLLAFTSYTMVVGPFRHRLAPTSSFPAGQALLFYASLLLLVLAEASPLHILADKYLFSAHMTQHLILSYAVPPLLLAGTPSWILRPLLLGRYVKPVARSLTHPVVALLVFDLFFAAWHFPAFYEGALQNELLHHVEHVLFIAAALMMWWPVLSPLPELPRLHYGTRIVYLFILPIGQLLVSAVLSFAQQPFYKTYGQAPRITALTAAADQQLGGIIMKVGSFFAFGVPLAITFLRWFQSDGQRAATSGTTGIRTPEPIGTRGE